MAAQKANLQQPEESAPRRPYGLTEDDHVRLLRTRNVLRLFQYIAEDNRASMLDAELLADAHCLLAEQIDQVLASTEAGEPTSDRRA